VAFPLAAYFSDVVFSGLHAAW